MADTDNYVPGHCETVHRALKLHSNTDVDGDVLRTVTKYVPVHDVLCLSRRELAVIAAGGDVSHLAVAPGCPLGASHHLLCLVT